MYKTPIYYLSRLHRLENNGKDNFSIRRKLMRQFKKAVEKETNIK